LPRTCYSLLIKFIASLLLIFSFCLFYPFQEAFGADTVTLVNGDRLTGRLLERKGDQLQFKTEYFGKIKVLWEHVQSLEVEEPALLLFDNGDTRSVLSVEIGEQKVMYRDSNDQQLHSISAREIVGISPEAWMENKSGFWSGRVNFSVMTERGNDYEGYVDFDTDVTYRRKVDRLRITGELENDSEVNNITGEKRTTKDKWLLNGSYNYFITKKTYLGASMSLEHDPLADLDLRATAGPLVGYQFFESKPLNLKAEVGVMFVNEEYRDAENNRYVQPAWHINFDKFIIEKRLQFYHEQYGVMNLDNEDQWFFRCWTGFRLPLGQGVQISAEYKLDYNHEPVNNNDSTESVFKLKLGYRW
jgi:putative salt-induced outer membrane protein YdiY